MIICFILAQCLRKLYDQILETGIYIFISASMQRHVIVFLEFSCLRVCVAVSVLPKLLVKAFFSAQRLLLGADHSICAIVYFCFKCCWGLWNLSLYKRKNTFGEKIRGRVYAARQESRNAFYRISVEKCLFQTLFLIFMELLTKSTCHLPFMEAHVVATSMRQLHPFSQLIYYMLILMSFLSDY